MVSVRQSVTIHRVRKQFGHEPYGVDSIAIDASEKMIRELDWWGSGLRMQRASESLSRLILDLRDHAIW